MQVTMICNESVVDCQYMLTTGALRSAPGAVPNFYEEVVQSYTDEAFRSHFRMNRSTMQARINITSLKHWRNRPALEAIKRNFK
jgi:hypothetical protein